MSYSDLLRDPRWQRKRLEVLNREDFTCQECGDRSTALHVHHTYYAKGRKPWEYEDDSLRCLCEPCHAEVTELTSKVHRALGALPSYSLQSALGYIRALVADDQRPAIRIDDDGQIIGICHALGVHFDDVIALRLRDGTVDWNELMDVWAMRAREKTGALEPDGAAGGA